MMRLRAYAYGVSALIVALVASPLFGAFGDDFPVSTYPMFASKRDSTVSIPSVVVVFADSSEAPASPSLVASDEVIQAFETIRQALRQGPEATRTLCEHVASGVRSRGAVEVRIQTATYDSIVYFSGDTEPDAVTVHERCAVTQ